LFVVRLLVEQEGGTMRSQDSPLENVNCIGFDMDHTLVRYNIPKFYKLVLKCFVNYLIEKENWDPEDLKYDIKSEYAMKGLVMDIEKGNVVTLDSNKHVLRAMHGLTPLTDQEILEVYPDPILHFDGHPPDRFFTATSYFEAAPCALYLHLVATQDAKGESSDYWPTAMALFSGYSHFMGNEKEHGSYYPEIKKNPGNYILKASQQLVDGLQHLKDGGIKLFLITNSSPDYTELVMKYAFGEKFHELFDVVVVNARKPYFFNSEIPFQEYGTYATADEGSVLEEGPNLALKPTPVLGGGNAHVLIDAVIKHYKQTMKVGQASLEKLKCLFVGDNILTDVVAPKSVNWATVAVVEELDHLYSGRFNKIWGSFFFNQTNNGEKLSTLWTNLIRSHADYCVESVDDLITSHLSPSASPLQIDEVALSPCIICSRRCKATKLLNKL